MTDAKGRVLQCGDIVKVRIATIGGYITRSAQIKRIQTKESGGEEAYTSYGKYGLWAVTHNIEKNSLASLVMRA